MLLLDEMAHIKRELFFETVAPIQQMGKTALIGLSSPDGSANYFSQLMNLTESDDSDEKFFKIINSILICHECRQLPKEEQLQCTHIKPDTPWLSSRKTRRLKRLYKADPAMGLRELIGVTEDDFHACFDARDIARVFALPPFITQKQPKQICVAVDPNGGGPSKMAIVSGYRETTGDNEFVVRLFSFTIP